MKKSVHAAAALAAAVLLSGCAGLSVGQTQASNAPASPTAGGASPVSNASAGTTSAGNTAAAQASASGASAVGIDLANPPAPLSTVKLPVSGSDVTSVTVDLVALERRGELTYGIFRFTPEGTFSGTAELARIVGFPFRPALVDNKALKKYQSVDELTTNAFSVKAPAGQPMYASSAWASPPAGTEVDVVIDTNLPQPLRVTVP